jgi:hypothetical protein
MSKMKGNIGNDFDFQDMLKNMGGMDGMGGGNGMGDMMNIMKNMFKPDRNTNTNTNTNNSKDVSKPSLKEKMKNRILLKKMQQAEIQLKEQNRIEEASKNFVPYTETSFTIDGEEKQPKSTAKKNKKKKNNNK